MEVVDAVVDVIRAERTAICFSSGTIFQNMYDDTVVETWSYLSSQLQKRYPNLGYLHFTESCSKVHTGNAVNDSDTLEPYRQIWKGPFISANGFSNSTQYAIDLAEKTGNLIAFGRVFIANPDHPGRLRKNQKLNHYDRSTFYTHDSVGYTDYTFYGETKY